MIIRPPASALRLRALAAATGLVLASTLLVPGAALAANGPPHPNTDVITTNEDTPASGNVLTNDTNGGQGPLIVTGSRRAQPGHRHAHHRRRRQLRLHPGRQLERDDVDHLRRRQQQAHPHRHDQHHRARGQRRTHGQRRHGHGDRGHGHQRHGGPARQRHRPRRRHARGHGRLRTPRAGRSASWPASSRSPRPPTRAARAKARSTTWSATATAAPTRRTPRST